MEKIASFTVNHLNLLPGIYVSRKDTVGKEIITTFDLRMTMPNREPVINTAELHTMEHLCATFLSFYYLSYRFDVFFWDLEEFYCLVK